MFRRSFTTTAKALEAVATAGSESWVKEKKSSSKIQNLMSETFQVLKEQNQEQTPINIHTKFVHQYDLGDQYDPFDFNVASAQFSTTKLQYPKTYNIKPSNFKYKDTFTRQGINPLDLYCSPYTLSRFLTAGGKILPRKKTGLSQKNHNLIAKLIRRARAIGFLSSVHQDIRFVPTRNN